MDEQNQNPETEQSSTPTPHHVMQQNNPTTGQLAHTPSPVETASSHTSKQPGLFSGFKDPKMLLKAVALVVGLGLIFYVGYELALYQTQNSDKLLPHINFSSNNSTGNCPPGEFYGYPDTANPTSEVCLNPNVVDKPVIYLYPTHTEKINVKVLYSAGFSKTVPTYNQPNGWEVVAQPSGALTDIANGKAYPYLFWEGNPNPSLQFDMTRGFVVEGSDTKNFLQQQLVSMGLNQNETTAFISYWLPRMENNPYNLIHFAGSEYTNAAKLIISPQPNSLLRVFMAFEPLQRPVQVTPQSFPTFQRVGFTAVEWGGTEL